MDKVQMIKQQCVKRDMPEFNVGDTIKVMTRIPEGDKVRLHPFEGVVIAKAGAGSCCRFTVRKMSFGEGIERAFPLFSPVIERIEVLRPGKVKRAKLYYLRGKIGKRATKIETKGEKAE
jgi:large subunit ribosomal protein L19